ncbi:hypothetical protein [Microbacterium soli]|uniref:Uncharacterized protein n=1 Tax=Microbacterium soli TaxID=446075 RepID=A0ABP7MJK4_9MICO
MGQNRRYDMVTPDIERAARRLERTAIPLSLGSEQLDTSGQRVDAADPVPVTAWVPHQVSYTEQVRVEAEAIAWTQKAALLRWTPQGRSTPSHVWVWADAVTRSP